MIELPTAEEAVALLEGKTEALRIPDPIWGDVLEVLRKHFYLGESWQYIVTALFVFQAHAAPVMPGVFYLFLGGRYGQGKTTLLNLLSKLTGGLLLENASIAALARTMGEAQTLCLDEIDVPRGREYDEIRDALLRQGYRADAAPYVRWDVTTKAPEFIPIFGPKAATFRGTLEDALQSRGFILPTVKPTGEEGFDLVLANLRPQLQNLPERLQAWGEDTQQQYTPDELLRTAYTGQFRADVRAAVQEIGANRESELAVYALLVAEMVGVDVVEELSKASELAQTLVGAASSNLLEEFRDVLLNLVGPIQPKLAEKAPDYRIFQKDVKDELNRRLKERGERPLGDTAFARLRQEARIEDTWIRRPGNRVLWILPEAYVGLPNLANMTNLNEEPGQRVGEVSQVSHVSLGSSERPLARVLHKGIAGTCRLCREDGEDRLVVEPRGSTDKIRICRSCAESRFDLGPPPGVGP